MLAGLNGWHLVIILTVLLIVAALVVGVVMVIVVAVRRGSGSTARDPYRPGSSPRPAPTSPPAGWHADPDGDPGRRWWDGQRWTEHRQSP
ncbi:DUF2510 domain-containing protein [Microbacterium sp. 13-71-7]|jgi:hypothetical protein|uniref:DUF2510 domain-containing protein n=1 Tax=Microbacterium sp. 13-71-7 TaxID=1970399 RepID=UPI0025E8E473|nr:DUF2510 domain-containing protein [Microbacterium sp. 13-71-7]